MTMRKIPLILYLQIVAFRALNKKCFINAAAIGDEQQEGRSFPFSNRSQELFISTHDATTGARVASKAPRQVHNPIIQENQRRTTKKRRTADINSASCLYQGKIHTLKRIAVMNSRKVAFNFVSPHLVSFCCVCSSSSSTTTRS